MANEVRALGTAEPAGAVEPAPVAD
jgi:hypothetical protein